jgi:hypothetical protein
MHKRKKLRTHQGRPKNTCGEIECSKKNTSNMPRMTQMPTNYFLKNTRGINVHKKELGTRQKGTKTHKGKPSVCKEKLGIHYGILETQRKIDSVQREVINTPRMI